MQRNARLAQTALVIFTFVASLVPTILLADDTGIEFYEKRIRPALIQHCYKCHSTKAKSVKGGLRLDSKQATLAGGESGRIIVPGKPEESSLIAAISHSGDFSEMPPNRKLPDRVIADFRKWIAIGAPLPEDNIQGGPQPQSTIDIEKGRKFWSFQPAKVLPSPKVRNQQWSQRKIDRFVLRKLEDHNLAPAKTASRTTLARRVYLDLIGLPPTQQQLDQFVADNSSAAYTRLVESLLESPRYGERWARHWLDVARYAEDNPTSEATCKPPRFAWQYRDWVIRAMNADLPYNEFVRRQLAADLQKNLPPSELAATGFLGLSPVYHKEPKLSAPVISVIVADEWDERLDTVTRGLLGLTVACARCHDHKFDPIRVQDYYALAGVMASTQLVEWPLVETSAAEAETLTKTREAIVDYQLRVTYAKKMQKAADIENRPTEPYIKLAAQHQKTLDALKAHKLFDGNIANTVRDAGVWVDGSDPDWTNMDYRAGRPRDLPIFTRGNPNLPGKIVPRRFIEVLSKQKPKLFQHGSGRLELADAIVGDAGPLAARVIVNRVWGWHFGRPLVATPSNFGMLGERPTHRQLLDDLAARFIDNGWSLKWLHREIVLSATYRQASIHNEAEKAQTIDPANHLLWRMNRRRLEPEVWRDAVLSVAGRLDTTTFGPSQDLEKPDNLRRTVYGTVSRQRPAGVLQLFDFPDAKRHSDRRVLTTTPLQQLYLLNGSFIQQQATALADSVTDKNQPDRSTAVQHLFQRVLLRDPTPAELKTALALIGSDATGLQLLAHSLLASNEFLFVD